MSSYVFAFRGRQDRSAQPGEDQEWGSWFRELGPAIADFGHRVGATRMVSPSNEEDGQHGQDGLVLAGYILVTADDLEEAAQLASGCPGLAHDMSVEVAEVVAA
jgi:hypothetical protein